MASPCPQPLTLAGSRITGRGLDHRESRPAEAPTLNATFPMSGLSWFAFSLIPIESKPRQTPVSPQSAADG